MIIWYIECCWLRYRYMNSVAGHTCSNRLYYTTPCSLQRLGLESPSACGLPFINLYQGRCSLQAFTKTKVEVAGAHTWFNQIEGRRVLLACERARSLTPLLTAWGLFYVEDYSNCDHHCLWICHWCKTGEHEFLFGTGSTLRGFSSFHHQSHASSTKRQVVQCRTGRNLTQQSDVAQRQERHAFHSASIVIRPCCHFVEAAVPVVMLLGDWRLRYKHQWGMGLTVQPGLVDSFLLWLAVCMLFQSNRIQ